MPERGWTLIGVAAVVIVGAALDPLIPDDQALPELAALFLTVANLLAPAAEPSGWCCSSTASAWPPGVNPMPYS